MSERYPVLKEQWWPIGVGITVKERDNKIQEQICMTNSRLGNSAVTAVLSLAATKVQII